MFVALGRGEHLASSSSSCKSRSGPGYTALSVPGIWTSTGYWD